MIKERIHCLSILLFANFSLGMEENNPSLIEFDYETNLHAYGTKIDIELTILQEKLAAGKFKDIWRYHEVGTFGKIRFIDTEKAIKNIEELKETSKKCIQLNDDDEYSDEYSDTKKVKDVLIELVTENRPRHPGTFIKDLIQCLSITTTAQMGNEKSLSIDHKK